MMNVLLESKPRKERKAGGTIFSVAVHSALIFFAVYATAQAGIADGRENREEKVTVVKTKVAEQAPKREGAKAGRPEREKVEPKPQGHQEPLAPLPPAPKAEIAPPKGFKVLQAPVNIPTTLPQR